MKNNSITASRKPNKVLFLPRIKGLSQNNSDYSLINVSATTNVSVIQRSGNNSTLIPCKSHRILKKIKLNRKSPNQINKSQIFSYNPNKKVMKIIENADQIMKERMKFHGPNETKVKKLFRKAALNISKEVSYKNYYINLLKEKRIEINEKEIMINNALKEFADQYHNDYKKFMYFVEDVKKKERNDIDTILNLRQKKEEKEKLLENEQLLNKRLDEILERKIKELYRIKHFGSFFHKLLNDKFIYDGTPEIDPRDKNHEEIANLLINIYEKEDKYNELPEELGKIEIFMKRYNELEDKTLQELANKEILDDEMQKIKNKYNKELEQSKLNLFEYEQDLNYFKNEIKNVNIDMGNYNTHEYENFENFLKFIVELGKEVGANKEIPNIKTRNLTDFAFYSEKVVEKLRGMEDKINTNILEIEKVLNYGNKADKELMESFILNQKNINKKEKLLKFKLLQEEMKMLEISKIFERGRKKVITGRKIIYDYPNNKSKNKIKKNTKKEDEDTIDYKYSESYGEGD